MQPDLARDAFNLERAADYLGIPVANVVLAVEQGRLACGVMATGWRGTALPILPGKGRWKGHVVDTRKDFVTGEIIKVYRYQHEADRPEGETEVTIEHCCAGQFWYLEHVQPGFAELLRQGQTVEVITLRPYDGADAHQHNPSWFPPPPFRVWIRNYAEADSKQPDRKLTAADVLFLRQDLNALLEQAAHEDPEARNRRLAAYRAKPISAAQQAEGESLLRQLLSQYPSVANADPAALSEAVESTARTLQQHGYSDDTIKALRRIAKFTAYGDTAEAGAVLAELQKGKTLAYIEARLHCNPPLDSLAPAGPEPSDKPAIRPRKPLQNSDPATVIDAALDALEQRNGRTPEFPEVWAYLLAGNDTTGIVATIKSRELVLHSKRPMTRETARKAYARRFDN